VSSVYAIYQTFIDMYLLPVLALVLMAFAIVHEDGAVVACSAAALEIERQRRRRGVSS
jgi:hypothetical protein